MLIDHLTLWSGEQAAFMMPLFFLGVLLSLSAGFLAVCAGYVFVRSDGRRRW